MSEITESVESRQAITASLHVRNYRLFFLSQGVSLTGTALQEMAQVWLVLHLSHDYLALGLVVALQYLPMLIFGAAGGVVADRIDKRRILQVTDAAGGVLALILAVLVATGAVRIWQVDVLALLLGITNLLNQPAGQSFTIEIVGDDLLANAVGLTMVEYNASRITGPLVAGVLLSTVGFGACFFVNAASFGISLVCLAAMRTTELRPAPPAAREPGQVRAGLRYVWSTPVLRTTLVLMAVMGVFGFNFPVTLALLAKGTFGAGPMGFTLLFISLGVGGIIGSLFVAGRAPTTSAGLQRIGMAFGALVVLVAAAPGIWTAALACTVTGVAAFGFSASGSIILQGTARPDMRGRVMALWVVALWGSFPIGAPLASWVAARTGPRGALFFGGFVCVMVCLIFEVTTRVQARDSVSRIVPSVTTEPPL